MLDIVQRERRAEESVRRKERAQNSIQWSARTSGGGGWTSHSDRRDLQATRQCVNRNILICCVQLKVT